MADVDRLTSKRILVNIYFKRVSDVKLHMAQDTVH